MTVDPSASDFAWDVEVKFGLRVDSDARANSFNVLWIDLNPSNVAYLVRDPLPIRQGYGATSVEADVRGVTIGLSLSCDP